MDSPFDLHLEGHHLTVVGEIDDRTLGAFRGALATHGYEKPGDLVVDLSRVTFLPSDAIGVMAVALKTAEVTGCQLDFIAATGTMSQRILDICGLPYRTEL